MQACIHSQTNTNTLKHEAEAKSVSPLVAEAQVHVPPAPRDTRRHQTGASVPPHP